MRPKFSEELEKQMELNDKIFVLTGDLGYGMWNKIRDKFPDRFINTGAAEHSLLGIASGLALEGKIPFVYSITPFLIYRPFEVLRTYIDHENIPVKLIGSGRDKDYEHDGFSHDASDVKKFLDPLLNIKQYYPESPDEIPGLIENVILLNSPVFVSLKR